jgi:hypothetical protein
MHKSAKNAFREFLVSVTAGAIALPGIVPTVALAMGWKSNDIIQDQSVQEKFKPTTMFDWVKGLITAFCGIAMVVFVARVVLTAIDRFIFVGPNNTSRLDEIPLIGAYPNPEKDSGGEGGSTWTWKRIWLNFAVQMALCVSAFAVTNFLFSIVATVLAKVAPAGATGATQTT